MPNQTLGLGATLKAFIIKYWSHLGVFGGLVTFGWQFFAWAYPSPGTEANDPELYGRWESKYGYPDAIGTVNLHGVTEFLEDDSYRYTGFITLTTGQPPIDMVFRVEAAGTWKGNDERIITKITGMNSSLTEVRKGKVRLDGSLLAQSMKEPPTLKDVYTMGSSERYTVIDLEEDKIKVQVDNLKGEPVAFDMLKTLERNPGKLLPID